VKTCEVEVNEALIECKVTWVQVQVSLSKGTLEVGIDVITHQLSII
jgi:hypothetical protein